MDLNELAPDVAAELADPHFLTRTHGKKATYQAGCRGPLCRKAERERKRASYRRNKGKVLEYPPRHERARDWYLEKVQREHEAIRAQAS